MKIFDLHCDTIDRLYAAGTGLYVEEDAGVDPSRMSDLYDNDAHISLARMSDVQWCQCFAIFMPDTLRGQEACDFFDAHYRYFRGQMEKYDDRIAQVLMGDAIDAVLESGKQAALLTVEGGSVLAGDLARVETLISSGVRILTLTWNGENEIASGNATTNGFSSFGRAAVGELERAGIVVDVSHLNDIGFWELAGFAEKSFIATHSNSRTVCDHPRNLTDDQFKEIAMRGGLVGINFACKFLSKTESDPSYETFSRHIEHFLGLGGEDVIALGSDYDGTDVPSWLSPCNRVETLYALLCQDFGEVLAGKICFENAAAFMKRSSSL